jgi:hypothetical protein
VISGLLSNQASRIDRMEKHQAKAAGSGGEDTSASTLVIQKRPCACPRRISLHRALTLVRLIHPIPLSPWARPRVNPAAVPQH